MYGQQQGPETFPGHAPESTVSPLQERRARRLAAADLLQRAVHAQYPDLFVAPAQHETPLLTDTAEIDPVARPVFAQGTEAYDAQEAA